MKNENLFALVNEFSTLSISAVDFMLRLQVDDTVRSHLEAAASLPDAVKHAIDVDMLFNVQSGAEASPTSARTHHTEDSAKYFRRLRNYVGEYLEDVEDDEPAPVWTDPVIEHLGGQYYRFIFLSDYWRSAFLYSIRHEVRANKWPRIIAGSTTDHRFYVTLPEDILSTRGIELLPAIVDMPSSSDVSVLTSFTAKDVASQKTVTKTKIHKHDDAAVRPYHQHLHQWIMNSDIEHNVTYEQILPMWDAPSIRKRPKSFSAQIDSWMLTFKTKVWRDAFIAALKREGVSVIPFPKLSMGATCGRFYVSVPTMLLDTLGITPLKDEKGAR